MGIAAATALVLGAMKLNSRLPVPLMRNWKPRRLLASELSVEMICRLPVVIDGTLTIASTVNALPAPRIEACVA